MVVLDFCENVFSAIGNFFNSLTDTLGSTLNWLSSTYPCTFRVMVMIFCLSVALAPFVIAGFETFKEEK